MKCSAEIARVDVAVWQATVTSMLGVGGLNLVLVLGI